MEDLSSVFICFRARARKGEGEIVRVREGGIERVRVELKEKEKGESKEEPQRGRRNGTESREGEEGTYLGNRMFLQRTI
jgi:hypothetical protein